MCVTPVSFSPDFFDILKCLYSLLCATLKEGAISSLKDWLIDSAIGSNPVPRLIAGIIFMQEQDYTRGCQAHTHTTEELWTFHHLLTLEEDALSYKVIK